MCHVVHVNEAYRLALKAEEKLARHVRKRDANNIIIISVSKERRSNVEG